MEEHRHRLAPPHTHTHTPLTVRNQAGTDTVDGERPERPVWTGQEEMVIGGVPTVCAWRMELVGHAMGV